MNKTTQVVTRSSKKIPAQFGMVDYYKFYNKNYPYKIAKITYNNIITDLNKFIVDEVVDKADTFALPHRIGYIKVVKRKQGVKLLPNNVVYNNAPPDWKATNDLWKIDEEAKLKKIIIRHKNSHTGGYVYNIKHDKYNANFKNKTVYLFKPARDFNRSLAKRINNYSKEKYNAHEIKY